MKNFEKNVGFTRNKMLKNEFLAMKVYRLNMDV